MCVQACASQPSHHACLRPLLGHVLTTCLAPGACTATAGACCSVSNTQRDSTSPTHVVTSSTAAGHEGTGSTTGIIGGLEADAGVLWAAHEYIMAALSGALQHSQQVQLVLELVELLGRCLGDAQVRLGPPDASGDAGVALFSNVVLQCWRRDGCWYRNRAYAMQAHGAQKVHEYLSSGAGCCNICLYVPSIEPTLH